MGVRAALRALFTADAAGGAGEAGAVEYGPPQSLAYQDNWLVRAIGGSPTKAGARVSEHMALNLTPVYGCVNRIANPIATFPLGICQKTPTGAVAKVAEHPMSDRLGLRPNDFMSSRTLRKTTQAHALLWGNGYQEIERNRAGEAVGLWPLLPDRTQVVRDPEAADLVVRTSIDGQSYTIPHGDVVHLMDLSHDGYRGISPIAKAREALGMALAMEEFGGKFFANDAKSGGFLMHPGRLGPQAQANLRTPGSRTEAGRTEAAPENPASRLEKQGGLENAHRVKVLEEGMKFIQTTIPPEDAQFLGSREFQIAEIARIFDVPLVLLQSHEKTTSWGTGIEQLMIGFVQQTIAPWVHCAEQELNWKLFTEAERAAGLYVKYNMKGLLRGDTAARAAFYTALFNTGGISPNMILAYEDEEGIGPDGDHHFVPMAMQPLDQAVMPPPPPVAPGAPPAPPEPAKEPA